LTYVMMSSVVQKPEYIPVADVCKVVAFLATDQASNMTAQENNLTGGQEMR